MTNQNAAKTGLDCAIQVGQSVYTCTRPAPLMPQPASARAPGRSAASATACGVVDITPDKSLIRKLGSTGYRTYEALSELIDNSIDARMSGPITIRVTLDYAGQSVVVSDDGVGMGLGELGDAMTLAKETDYPRGKKLGMFGLGMKTACSFLGRTFAVTASRPGADLEYAIEYDEGAWEMNASAGWKNFPYSTRAKRDKRAHGTSIAITKLKVPLYPEQTTIFKKRFGERYAEYIRDRQAIITVNSVTCAPVSPVLEKGSARRFKVKTSAGMLPAQIGLLRRRSVVGSYGIDLYYRGRLIKAHTRFGIRDHPEVAKVVGRISLDHVPVNFYKTGYNVESGDYKEAEDAFRNHPAVKDVIKRQRSGALRAPADPQAIYDYILGRAADPPRIDARLGRDASKRLLDSLGPLDFAAGGLGVRVEYDSAGGDLYTAALKGKRLEVTINTRSPLFATVKNPLYLVAMAVTEARAMAAGGAGTVPLFKERNRAMSSLIGGWARGAAAGAGRPTAPLDAKEYRLATDLEDLYSFLNTHYPFKFTFSGLSTLLDYTHNALGYPFYSLYTEKAQGGHLLDAIFKCRGDYAPLLDPVGDDLKMFFGLASSRPIIVVREFPPGEIAAPLAPPARAWMDLFREVSRYRMPLAPEDLSSTLEGLRDRRLLVKDDLVSVLRRRGKRDMAMSIIEQVFAAQ